MDDVRVRLLGAFQVSSGGVVRSLPGARLQGLLARLALAGGRAVEPAVLVGAIWPEEPPSGPGPALQTLVSRLRRALFPDVVVQVGGGYRLAAADVDALHFERLAAAGRDSLRRGDLAAAETALAEAVALWGDRPGSAPAAVAAVAPAVATRLARLSVEAVADLAEAELFSGRAEAAAARLAALLAEQPVHERAAGLLMDALAAVGREAEALAVYERVRGSLADVLGADPGTALRDRHLRLLRPTPPPPPSPPASRAGPPAPPGQSGLPAPLTSFIGRDDDLARVGALLTAGRLATVLGPGGAGKTRLAIEAARRRPGEVRLVDLASVTEPAKVATAVLAAIGLRGGALLDARRRPEDVLAGELGGRESLLLLDNCEHLIDAVAHLVAELLSRCPGLRVLATSREPLAIDGEALVPLGPLTLPEPGDGVTEAGRTAAVRLFVERAAAVHPGFAVDPLTLPLIKDVVRALDGLPLALELAAARLRTLSLDELAAGLSDRFRLLTSGNRTAPPRHRTLRAVIAWSWDLLDDRERVVAERISILPGGVTPASAAAVCAGIPVAPDDLPDLLAALVDRSLLQLAPGRYRMLESIREYGAERVDGAARDLAAAHFATLIAGLDPRLRGPGQLTTMKKISAEYDNVLAALRHRCAAGDSRGAIALALTLTWYWQMSGRQSDGAYWLGEALAVPGGGPAADRDCARAVYLLNRADILSGRTAGEAADDRAEMRELAARLLDHRELPGHYRVFGPILLFLLDQEAALPHWNTLAAGDDAWLSALAHMFLTEIAENAGRLDRMRTHVEASLARFREVGDHWGQAAVLPMRAQLRRYDDVDGALADLAEARTLAGEFGGLSLGDQLYSDLRWIDLLRRRGDTGEALALIDAARARARQASSAEMLLLVDACEAGLRIGLGELDRAAELLGDTAPPADRAALCLALGDLTGAEAALREAYAAGLETRELPVLAPVTVHAAALAAARDRPHESAVLLGVAARLRGAHDHADPQVRELTARGRAALGAEEFDAAYATGWKLDAPSAVTAAAPVPQG
jgi:predicted ATPase/DNA-binding SARP family transcriptional activator